jgi:hypothetical protein
MATLLLIGFVGAVLVLYAAERLLKARRRVRQLRRMSDRLEAAARRAEHQHEQRQAVAQASAALTAFMPAIKAPPLTVPGTEVKIGQPESESESQSEAEAGSEAESEAQPKAKSDCERAARPDHGRVHRGPRTGEQRAHTAEQPRTHTGEQRAHTAELPRVHTGEQPRVRTGEHGVRSGEHPVRSRAH